MSMPRLAKGLSARLLLFTAFFVMLSEILIYVPSISRFRLVYLQERATEGYLAARVLDAAPGMSLAPMLEEELLQNAGVLAVELLRPEGHLLLGQRPAADAEFDLEDQRPWVLIHDAFETMGCGGERIIAYVIPHGREGDVRIRVHLNERAMYRAMYDYSWRILALSIAISLLTAGLVFFTLQWLMVRPMRRITANLIRYREAPQDASRVLPPTERGDELGLLQRELRRMQNELRQSLQQKSRLAALGTAVSQITHDLRGILNTADLFAERLQLIDDPGVKRVTPLLVSSLDRAVLLCTQTLDLARGDQAVPSRSRFELSGLVREAGAALGLMPGQGTRWHSHIPDDLAIQADYDRLFRVFMNLGRNAVKALDGDGAIEVNAAVEGSSIVIEFSDDGPGIPPEAQAHLFEPFAGSASSGGTGLGLATARDLVRAHGGELLLVKSDTSGTIFTIRLPVA